MLFFLPLASVWMARSPSLRARRHPGRDRARRSSRRGRSATIARLHRFVLVASEGGVTFWTGNHPLARGEGDLAANPDIKRAEIAFREAHPGLTAEQLEPLYYRDAIHYICGTRSGGPACSCRKVVLHGRAGGPVVYATLDVVPCVASVASYLLLLPFAVLGAGSLAASTTPAGGAVRAGGLRGDCLSRVLPAGAVPDSRDRPGADRMCGIWYGLR